MLEENEKAIEVFVSRLRRTNRQESTIELYKKQIEDFFTLHKDKSWKKINEKDIDSFCNWRMEQNKSRCERKLGRGIGRVAKDTDGNPVKFRFGTLNVTSTALRRFFSISGRKDFVPSRPRNEEWMPPEIELEHVGKLLTEEAIVMGYKKQGRKPRKFIVKRDSLLINFIFATGARISECSKLMKQNLDIDKEKPTVTFIGKGNKKRTVPLSKRWIEMYKEYNNNSKERTGNETFIFTTVKGNKLSTGSLQTFYRQAAKAVKVNDLRAPHRMRHAYATYLVERGENIRTVQNLLGHTNISVTGKYIDLIKGKEENVKSPLDDFVEKKTKEVNKNGSSKGKIH